MLVVQVQGSGDTIALYHQHAGVGSESMDGGREGGRVRHGVEGGAGTAACVWELERARIECREGEVECRAAWEVERSGRDELIARCSRSVVVRWCLWCWAAEVRGCCCPVVKLLSAGWSRLVSSRLLACPAAASQPFFHLLQYHFVHPNILVFTRFTHDFQ